MNFDYTEEQRALRDSLQRFIEKEYSFEKRRALIRSGESFNREVWAHFAELGLLALTVPEDCGGIGGNAVDTMLVMECMSKGLVLEPYLACAVLATTAEAVIAAARSGGRTFVGRSSLRAGDPLCIGPDHNYR